MQELYSCGYLQEILNNTNNSIQMQLKFATSLETLT